MSKGPGAFSLHLSAHGATVLVLLPGSSLLLSRDFPSGVLSPHFNMCLVCSLSTMEFGKKILFFHLALVSEKADGGKV